MHSMVYKINIAGPHDISFTEARLYGSFVQQMGTQFFWHRLDLATASEILHPTFIWIQFALWLQ